METLSEYSSSQVESIESQIGTLNDSSSLALSDDLNLADYRTTFDTTNEYVEQAFGSLELTFSGESNENVSDSIREASDQSSTPEEQVVSDFAETLVKAGMSESEANDLAKTSMDRLSTLDSTQLNGSPIEQLERVNKALENVYDAEGEPLSREQLDNFVLGAAHRFSNPDAFGNQGKNNTCALTSMGNQFLEAGDPALVIEQMASVLEHGHATIVDGTTGQARIVNVDQRSLIPDQEASIPFSEVVHGHGGKRDLAGQVWDAFAGQASADLQAERENLPPGSYVYLTANADMIGVNSSTGEGLFRKDGQGNLQYQGNSPEIDTWDLVHLNRAMGGNDGAFFVHEDIVGSTRPPREYPQDLKITTFKNTDELKDELADYHERTGQSAQLGVNAPFLPGGGKSGHGMHAVRIRLEDDGQFQLDNNWSSKHDLKDLSDDAIDEATNPDRWDERSRPNADTIYRPGSGRNPNETQDDFEDRTDKNADQKKDSRLETQELNRKIAQTRFDIALVRWELQKFRLGEEFNEPRPNLAQFQI